MQKRIKILHFPGSFATGGVETLLINLYRNIDKAKYQFDFCVPRAEEEQYDKEVVLGGSKIITIPKIRDVGIIRYINRVKRIILQNSPYDVVHIHAAGYNGVYSVVAAKMAGIKKIIYHVHSTNDPSLKKLPLLKLYKMVTSQLIKILCTNCIACSINAARFVYGEHYLIKSKALILNNAIDINKYKPYIPDEVLVVRKKFKIPEDSVVIGNAARFVNGKNQSFLIRMIGEISQKKAAVLLLAGNGETKSDCEHLAKELGVRNIVLFLGHLDIEEMPDFYNALDVFILPSDYEGLGIAIIEAEACGIPCIVSEAVPQDSDIGLGLWHSINLNCALTQWSDLVLSLAGTRLFNSSHIKTAVIQKGFNIFDSVKRLENIYKITLEYKQH